MEEGGGSRHATLTVMRESLRFTMGVKLSEWVSFTPAKKTKDNQGAKLSVVNAMQRNTNGSQRNQLEMARTVT